MANSIVGLLVILAIVWLCIVVFAHLSLVWLLFLLLLFAIFLF